MQVNADAAVATAAAAPAPSKPKPVAAPKVRFKPLAEAGWVLHYVSRVCVAQSKRRRSRVTVGIGRHQPWRMRRRIATAHGSFGTPQEETDIQRKGRKEAWVGGGKVRAELDGHVTVGASQPAEPASASRNDEPDDGMVRKVGCLSTCISRSLARTRLLGRSLD